MLIFFNCTYCNHKWEEQLYNTQSVKNQRCPVCKDKHPKAKEQDPNKVDYYQGCPPFPEKLKMAEIKGPDEQKELSNPLTDFQWWAE